MQLELVDMQRRIQARVPLPWIQPEPEWLAAQQRTGRPVVRFDDIPLDWTDFRLSLRQTATILHRFEAIDRAEHQHIEVLARDGNALQSLVTAWYAATSGVNGVEGARQVDEATPQPRSAPGAVHPAVPRALRRGAGAAHRRSRPGTTATARSAAGNRISR